MAHFSIVRKVLRIGHALENKEMYNLYGDVSELISGKWTNRSLVERLGPLNTFLGTVRASMTSHNLGNFVSL